MSMLIGGAPRLSGDQLIDLLTLTEHADCITVKTSVPDTPRHSGLDALGLDPLDARVRELYFFDTADLRLNAGGLILRAARRPGKPDSVAVRLRPVDPSTLSPDIRRSSRFAVEVEAAPAGFVCSASVAALPARASVNDVARRGAAVSRLFSREQRELLAGRLPLGVALDDLSALGPIVVLRVKCPPTAACRRLAAELWLYPDDHRIVELTARCAPGDAFRGAAEIRELLAVHGLDPLAAPAAADYASPALRPAV